MSKKLKLLHKILLLFLFLFLFQIIFRKEILAQELNISVSPPITEILMMPGKEVVQTYKLTNHSDSKIISVDIVPFLPDLVNPEEIVLNEKEGLVQSATFRSWFRIEKPNIAFGEKFNLPANSDQDIFIKISIPENTIQKDYYFTVLFSVEKTNTLFQGNFLETAAQIGSNILISASEKEDLYKSANTLLFSSPFLVDSLQNITFKIIIENTGRAFAKPTGILTIENMLSKKKEVIKLSPLNILVSSSREIFCLKDQEVVECKSEPKIHFGLYKSVLKYTLDDQGQNYQEETYTFAFPFSLIITVLTVYLIYKIIIVKTKNT